MSGKGTWRSVDGIKTLCRGEQKHMHVCVVIGVISVRETSSYTIRTHLMTLLTLRNKIRSDPPARAP